MNKCYLISAVVFLLFIKLSGQENLIIIDQGLVATATFEDKDLIDFFMESYMILDETEVTKMQMIDATNNGFGEHDLIKCFPSGQIYFMFPNEDAESRIKSWEFTSNKQIVSGIYEPETFKNTSRDREANWILGELLTGINQHYHDLPLKIYFERDQETVTLDMWGFVQDSLYWINPPPPIMYPDTAYDLVHIYQSDTLYVADTTYYDQFYVYHNIADTVFISEKDNKFMVPPIEPAVLPGVVRQKK